MAAQKPVLDVPQFLEREDVAAFIGPNFEKFKTKWLKDWARTPNADRTIVRLHWNTGAVLLWPVWFGYRKMHRLMAGLVALMCVIAGGINYYNNANCAAMDATAFTGVSIISGLMATNIYFAYVRHFFERHQNADAVTLKQHIAKQGGVSVLSAVLWVVAIFGSMLLTVYVIDMLMSEQVIFCESLATMQGPEI